MGHRFTFIPDSSAIHNFTRTRWFMSKFFFHALLFCRDRNSVTDETLLPIGYSVESGEVRKNRGEVGG
jgi:hypothetical protein